MADHDDLEESLVSNPTEIDDENDDNQNEPLVQEQKNDQQQNINLQQDEEEKHEKNRLNSDGAITVAVTGASGFIAAHCIQQLLDKGYNVRGTVRGDPSSDKYKWLYTISDRLNSSNQVKLYRADLLSDGSFNECFKGCDYIFHVASPFNINVDDPMNDLVKPAKEGTLNVLNCALNSCNETLKRIVITSSVASVNGLADPNKIYTENDWNDQSDLTHGPYSYSKTEAERATWNWMDNNKTKISFDIVTINPALVLGKHLNDGLKVLNESNDVLGRIINGAFPARINVAFTIVDVRDVAAAHIFMIENERAKKSAQGRYICSYEFMSLSTLMDYCRSYCKKNKMSDGIPCCRCDCSCCWCCIMCIACCEKPGEADYLRGNVNKQCHYSNQKLLSLGFEFRDINSTLVYALDYLRDAGFIAK